MFPFNSLNDNKTSSQLCDPLVLYAWTRLNLVYELDAQGNFKFLKVLSLEFTCKLEISVTHNVHIQLLKLNYDLVNGWVSEMQICHHGLCWNEFGHFCYCINEYPNDMMTF